MQGFCSFISIVHIFIHLGYQVNSKQFDYKYTHYDIYKFYQLQCLFRFRISVLFKNQEMVNLLCILFKVIIILIIKIHIVMKRTVPFEILFFYT